MDKNLSAKAIKSKLKSQIDKKKQLEKLDNKLADDLTNLMINTFDKTKELKAIKAHLNSTKREFKTAMTRTFTELNSALQIVNKELEKNVIRKKAIKNG